VPTICDPQLFSLWECPVGTSCQCDFNFFGLFCFVYSCPPKDAAACGYEDAYCPSNAPNCDAQEHQCYGDATIAPMLHSVPAHRRA
jgi:hypothetical protein